MDILFFSDGASQQFASQIMMDKGMRSHTGLASGWVSDISFPLKAAVL